MWGVTMQFFELQLIIVHENVKQLVKNRPLDITLYNFLSYADECIPNRMVTVRLKDKPWYTNDLSIMKRNLDSVHKTAKKCNKVTSWGKFRKLRNAYIKL